jgi:hypothetical protein
MKQYRQSYYYFLVVIYGSAKVLKKKHLNKGSHEIYYTYNIIVFEFLDSFPFVEAHLRSSAVSMQTRVRQLPSARGKMRYEERETRGIHRAGLEYARMQKKTLKRIRIGTLLRMV